MARLPDGYPHGATDVEILEALTGLANDVANAQADINSVMRLAPLISVGQSELQARFAASASGELQSAIDSFRESSDKASKTLIRLTWVLVGLTFALVFLTVVLLLKD